MKSKLKFNFRSNSYDQFSQLDETYKLPILRKLISFALNCSNHSIYNQ